MIQKNDFENYFDTDEKYIFEMIIFVVNGGERYIYKYEYNKWGNFVAIKKSIMAMMR